MDTYISLKNKVSKKLSSFSVEQIFLILSIVFGGLFLIITPPTQSADETTHFYRAYQLSQGGVLSEKIEEGYGATMPRDVQVVTEQLFNKIPSDYTKKFDYGQLKNLLARKIDTKDKIPIHLEGATVYSPVSYIPQTLAIMVSKIAWPSVAFMYYLGRLFNLIVWIAITYLAIKNWPGNKWPLFCIALIPMSLSQAASLSPDALTNSLAFLTVALFLQFSTKTSAILTTKKQALLVGCVVALSLCKPVFFVFALLPLLFTGGNFIRKKGYSLFAVTALVASVIVTAAWNLTVQKYSIAIAKYYLGWLNIDSGEQVRFLLHNPLSFIPTFFSTYFSNYSDFIYKSFTGRLGWWDTDLPLWIVATIFGLIMLATIGRDARDKPFNFRQKIVPLFVFVLGLGATSVILYITITTVGANKINGLQGRYFIAFVPLLMPVLFGRLTIVNWHRIAATLFPISYSGILLLSIIILANRFL